MYVMCCCYTDCIAGPCLISIDAISRITVTTTSSTRSVDMNENIRIFLKIHKGGIRRLRKT